MSERWKPISRYEGLYEVSDQGNVRSLPRRAGTFNIKGRMLKQFRNRGGYRCGTRAKRARTTITENIGVPVIQISSDGHTALAAYDSFSLAAEAVCVRATDICDSAAAGSRCRGFYWRRLNSITERDLIFWAGTGERVSGPKKAEYPRTDF